jgi:hypothetical protein
LPITIEALGVVPYLETKHLGDGRTVKLMPLWDGQNWRLWLETGESLTEAKITDTVEGDYLATIQASESDLFIPFVHLMWQRLSYPEIVPLIAAISDDFHNMGTSVAKCRFFFDHRKELKPATASRFAHTELEYLLMLCRSVFDLLQEAISITWGQKVRLHDQAAERRRSSRMLPSTFSKIVLIEKRLPRTAAEIAEKFGLPPALAEKYEKLILFFSRLRDARDNVVHGKRGFGRLFDTERGFCVDPAAAPFKEFDGWLPEHRYNENLVSALPWIADTISQTINACTSLMDALASIIQLPSEIAPGYKVFVRGPNNWAMVELFNIHSGESARWS